jgi:23S rRNA (adenine2030-N6)-methyltransferase
MNYRHIYHAGNFADVFKHILLLELMLAMQHKDKPFCYLETHAGLGYYAIKSALAQKTKEAEQGIVHLLTQAVSPLLEGYLDVVKQANERIQQVLSSKPSAELRYYPGSPYFARELLRRQDRMVLCELHPEDVITLKQMFKDDKQVACHHQDGYLGLKAFLPPKEQRGLVLIDPPYEDKEEFTHLTTALTKALHHWRQGVFAIWYPIKAERHHHLLLNHLKTITQAHRRYELCIHPLNTPHTLNGCGMVIINPPWQIEQKIKPLMRLLQQVFPVTAL